MLTNFTDSTMFIGNKLTVKSSNSLSVHALLFIVLPEEVLTGCMRRIIKVIVVTCSL